MKFLKIDYESQIKELNVKLVSQDRVHAEEVTDLRHYLAENKREIAIIEEENVKLSKANRDIRKDLGNKVQIEGELREQVTYLS